ncbi:MAG TPA: hypothetical protein VJU87_01065 [Gemmatimonadaceae bacterium]|nr:hypothetical protein [Gemmatimonadaceae bacterium]
MIARPDGARVRELHLESMVGKPVCDAHGVRVGRLEEVLAERQGIDIVVLEYHLGPAAALERIIDFAGGLPLLRALRRFSGQRYTVGWREMDLSIPDRPRTTVPKAQLEHFRPGA